MKQTLVMTAAALTVLLFAGAEAAASKPKPKSEMSDHYELLWRCPTLCPEVVKAPHHERILLADMRPT